MRGKKVEYWKTRSRARCPMRPAGRKMASEKKGSVLIMSVFVIALLSALVIGILQINMSEIRLTQHRVYASQALAVAEAGLNDAMSEIRNDSTWTAGFKGKAFSGEERFGGGEYTVDGNNHSITVTATVDEWDGYTSTLEAQISTTDGNSPHIIRIDDIKVNE
jgi:Tfp pilus assembly protein PilX